MRLEEIKRGADIRGVVPLQAVRVVYVKLHTYYFLELIYKDASGNLGQQLLSRDREDQLELVAPGRAWGFDADADAFRLVSEAYRIRLAYIFDPLLAVHTSDLDPLPHQLTAVYEEMLPRQPLRFLLADDPGAGKTIMTGLLIKELTVRADVRRCLICCPGNLAEQWQDELWRRFHLDFKIVSNQTMEDSKTGNPYLEIPLAISRLDHMSRSEAVQEKLRQSEWDLVVVDEAHKMSAHVYGQEIKETKRYKLGRLLGDPERTRHFLLLTATPHSGKEADFQVFMALLDRDRFEGRFRDGVHRTNASDLMRRLVKESLVKFDGTPLFPERKAYTVSYKLSDLEFALYAKVTEYVREEMNRADRLIAAGEGRRGNRVGFALTSLQRRLASSPRAIHQSLVRRRERQEKRLREEKLLKRAGDTPIEEPPGMPDLDEEDIANLEDAPEDEARQVEQQVVEQASAARTISELEREIQILCEIEELAAKVLDARTDKKWEELSRLLQNTPEMFGPDGRHRKMILFTEHRDTLAYLAQNIRGLIGRKDAVVEIHGGMGREERRDTQEAFTNAKDVQILVATDAAGEGINLQRAHLMVNYDLPWNPNRLEQRFGRIHRIGQAEVCHMWNLVAEETREGDVFQLLLKKLERESQALGGHVFDILGRVFEGTELRKLLIEAIRYGENPEVKARLRQVVDEKLDRAHLQQLIEERALAHDVMTPELVRKVRRDLERAEARRLQPHFIRSFFLEAFRRVGGVARERESRRYEITHVPAALRGRDRPYGADTVLPSYERIVFEKELIPADGKPPAAFVCPGHPLLDAVVDLALERDRELLRKGTVLLDPGDVGEEVRALFYLEHAVQDARMGQDGRPCIASREMHFVEIDRAGNCRDAGCAPYLDYRPLAPEERVLVAPILEEAWLGRDLEDPVTDYAVMHLVPRHFDEVKRRREGMVARTLAEVRDRLTKEINYWNHKAEDLRAKEEKEGRTSASLNELIAKLKAEGKLPAVWDQEKEQSWKKEIGKLFPHPVRSRRENSERARHRADEFQTRLDRRVTQLEQEKALSPLPPVVVGGALVVPAGLVERLRGERLQAPDQLARDRKEVEAVAMAAVLDAERRMGNDPRDVSGESRGYNVESADGRSGRLRFIEVKGRVRGAPTVTITKNEILTALNKPDDYVLAVVEVEDRTAWSVGYVRRPFQGEPDFGVTSVDYRLDELLARAQEPS